MVARDDSIEIYEATTTFLDDHPEATSILEHALTADAEQETWTFENVSIDSGMFGELVSRGIVEKVDGRYRIADREGVQGALDGTAPTTSPSESVDRTSWYVDLGHSAFNYAFSARMFGLVLALGFVGVLRTVFLFGEVFRRNHIVLPANDPYRYRYWLEQLIASDLQPWRVSDLQRMPETVATNDVLFYWLAWLAAALLGNSPEAVSTVLVWYPVITAMLTGLAVYGLTIRLTGEYRIGIASVFMLALMPIHASYTALGFGDHHALDYLILVIIGVSFVLVVDNDPAVRVVGRSFAARWVGAVGLGLALAAQNAAWRGGPLWLIGIVFVILVLVVVDVDDGRSPMQKGIPLLVGIGLAAILTGVFRYGFDWLESYRTLAPVLMLLLAATLFASGEILYRRSIPTRLASGGIIGTVGAITAIAWVRVPAFSETVTHAFDYFRRHQTTAIVETYSIFSPEFSVIGGPILYLGLPFVLGLISMCGLTWVAIRDSRSEWVAVTSLGWYLLAWATVQVRFAAEFAPFLAVFAGVGFIYLLSWVNIIPGSITIHRDQRDAVRGEAVASKQKSNIQSVSRGEKESVSGRLPAFSEWDRTRAAYAIGVLILIGSLSFIFIPGYMTDISVEESTYETATWINDYSSERGYEYPDTYVFSPWGDNLRYNYFVSGESASYSYAQNHYEDFITATDTDAWYAQLRSEGRFVVTHDVEGNIPANSAQATLHERLGSRGDGVDGASHYRAIYVTEDRERVVFELVPGTRLTGTAPPNETVVIETEVDVEGKPSPITYQREVQTNRYGDYGVTVPYPGMYEIGTDTKSVTLEDIESGSVLGGYRAHWTLDEGTGDTITDPVGGDSATVDHAEWVDGVSGSALTFDGEGSTTIREDSARGIANDSITMMFWMKGDLTKSDVDYPTVLHRGGDGRIGFWGRTDANDFGVRFDDVDGTHVRAYGIETTEFQEWTLITAVLDRDEEEVRLYQNETLVSVEDASTLGAIDDSGPLAIGGRPNSQYATVTIDNVRMYATAVDEETIKEMYERGDEK